MHVANGMQTGNETLNDSGNTAATAAEGTVVKKPQYADSIGLGRRIVDIAEEKQAIDIVLLDVREQTSIADYFVIATVDNERQARAIENDLLRQLRLEENIRPLGLEGAGASGSGWSLFDYGDVIVHLFTEESRAHYNLEELWSEASVVLKVI